jgi:4-amino-4-deoxy-L-arabinose transferase-like glycosyltransferase
MPRAALWLVLFFGVWMLPGLVGRDPWKADEGYSFGLVLHMLETGDWVIPQLAGEPFMQKPPLLFAVSAVSAELLSWLLPLHDGARGSVAFFNVLTFIALGLAARELWGPGRGWLAPVLFLGAPGLLHNQHLMLTDVALMTGFAVGHYGLVLCRRRPWVGGAVAGTGMGMAFLAKGLLGPGLMGLTALALPLSFPSWRSRNYLFSLLAMGLAALPWVVVWPTLVYARSPELFREWLIENNFGRFTGTTKLVRSKPNYLFYLKTLPWFALPSVALAIGYWWRRRREWRVNPGLQLTLLSFGVMLVIFSVSRQARTLYAQPMVVPLALAGVLAVDWLTGRPARWLNRFCAVMFGVLAGVAWVGWGLLEAQWLEALAQRVRTLVPDYAPAIRWWLVFPAALATGWFAWRLRTTDFDDGRAAMVNWAAGLGLMYLLGMTLFLPLANANMGYRGVFLPLREHLPQPPAPVASIGLAESERGLLHYLAGLKTRRVEVAPEALDECDWVFIQGNFKRGRNMGPPPRGEWTLVFEGRRGGDESYRLYRRAPTP